MVWQEAPDSQRPRPESCSTDARIPDADLFVTEIGVFPKLDSQYDEIYDEITLAISDLVHEQPHAYDFLRGRTFARRLH